MADWAAPGFEGVTPYLIVKDAAAALDFYARAFGAEETMRLTMGDKIGHAEMRINGHPFMLADEFPEMDKISPASRGHTTVSMMFYVKDCDAVFAQAIAAGATEIQPMQDQFYGDRSGQVRDPFGHEWSISTFREELSNEELQRRMDEMIAGGES